jgi:hypothetical protein
MQTTLMKDPTTQIKETVLCTASDTVQEHGVIEVLEELSLSSTEAACKNSQPLLDWDEYNQVAL